MMQQLENIFTRLKTDRGQDDGRGRAILFAVTITNADTARLLCRNKTAAEMEAEQGSVEGYFNSLFTAGAKNIVIQPRKKNGSSFIDADPPQTFSFKPKESTMPQTELPTLNHAIPMPTPAFGGGLMGGLNGIEGAYRYMDYPKLAAENEKLKLENETLKEKLLDMKEAALENRFSADKASGNKEMLTGLMEVFGPIATALITKGATAGVGLGAPEPQPEHAHLSVVKQELIQAIMINPDMAADFLTKVLHGANTIDGFLGEIEKILLTHNLTAA